MKKRILSILLSLCMVCMLLPTTALAATDGEINDAVTLRTALQNGGTYTLTASFTCSRGDNLELTAGKTLTITGDGQYTITMGSTYQLMIPNTSTMTLKNLTIDGGSRCIKNEGTLTMDQVTLKGASLSEGFDTTHGAGLYNAEGATAILTNCNICDNINNGNSSRNGHGGGFYNAGKLIMENCAIVGNKAPGINGYGGGGGGYNCGTLYMNNCTVANNQSSAYGGGIYHTSNANTYLMNCTVTGNITTYRGGGITTDGGSLYAVNSVFAFNYYNPNDPTINDIYGSSTLYSCAYGQVTPEGSTISGCQELSTATVTDLFNAADSVKVEYYTRYRPAVTAFKKGGFISYGVYPAESSALQSGGTKTYYNRIGSTVKMSYGSAGNNLGTLATTANQVTTYQDGTTGRNGGSVIGALSGPPPHVHALCQTVGCMQDHNGDGNSSNAHEPVEFTAWESDNALPTSGTYYLTKDVTLSSKWQPTNDTVLCLNGHTITMKQNDPVIVVWDNVTFTLTDCGTTGEIRHGQDSHGQKYSGRGVLVGGGTFNMYGGTITGNTYSGDGGGVRVTNYSSPTFNMYDGTITGNTATDGGGGVYVDDGCTFKMSGDASITSNTATNGGGVYVTGSGKFEMSGGSISDNTAEIGNGGGVYMDGGEFTMSGGTIEENLATDSTTIHGEGGGVCINSGSFTMLGGSITENTALKYGGVCVCSNGTFTVSGKVTVTGNKVSKTENNVYLFTGKSITIGDSDLDSAARIGVANKEPTVGNPIRIATNATGDVDYAKIFTPDVSNKGYVITKDGTNLYLSAHQHSWTYAQGSTADTITATCAECPLATGGNTTNGSITIKAPAVSEGQTLTYDGSAKAATVDTVGGLTAPSITYKQGDNELSGAPTDAGTYTASITVTGAGEGNTATAFVTYTINPKVVTAPTIKLEGSDTYTCTYTGNEQKPTVTVKDGETVIPTTEYTVAYGNNINAGVNTATVTITDKDGGNYTVSGSKTFTITAKNIAEVAADTTIPDQTYTGNQISPDVTLKYGNKTLVKDTDYTLSYRSNTDVGRATVTITGKGNYNGEKNITFNIKEADMTGITADSYSGTYDGNPHGITVKNVPDGATVRYGTTKDDCTRESLTYTNFTNGEQTVYYKVSKANYKDVKGSATVNITKATPNVTQWPTVNGTVYVNGTATLNNDGVVENSVAGTFALAETSWTSEGNKTTTITFTPNSANYKAVTKTDFSVTVVKRTVKSVDVQSPITSKNYGTAQADLGLPSAVSITTVDGKKFNSVPVTWSGYNPNTLNEQTLTGTLNLSDIEAEVKQPDTPITAAIDVTLQELTPGSVTYANKVADYTGALITHEISPVPTGISSISYSYEGINGTEYVASATAPTNAGTYQVTATFTMAAGYAQVASKTANLTINKVDYNETKTASDSVFSNQETTDKALTLPALPAGASYAASGTVGGTTALISEHSVSDGILTYSTTSQNDETTATITIPVTGATNYNPYNVVVTITASAKANAGVAFVTLPTGKTYGDADYEVSASVTNAGTNGDWTWTSSDPTVMTVTKNAENGAKATVHILKAGNATITVKYESDTTKDELTSGAITVNKKPITAPAADTTEFTYNGLAQTYGISSTGDYTVADNVQTNANESGYTVTVALRDKDNTKWAGDGDDTADKPYTFIIKKATITVTAQNQSIYVGEAAPTLNAGSYTVTGLVNGETLATLPTAVYASEPNTAVAGTVTINVSGAAAPAGGNYNDIVYVPGTLTISTRPSSGGGYTPPTYKVESEVTEATDGSVSFSKSSAKKDDAVTITVTPDRYYKVDGVTVKDKDGKEIAVTDNGDGTFTFQMPDSKVTVEPVFSWDNPFTDVDEDAYYAPAVEWALKNEVTSGTGDGTTFSPNAGCTRAQIMTFLWQAAGCPEPAGDNSFTDVSADAYYAKAVAWAVEQGITSGTGGGKFSPEAICTRSQSMTFLYHAAGSPEITDGIAFDDVADGSYYADAVVWAARNGVTSGTGNGMFSPEASCTRAQIMTFLYQWMVQ